MSDIQWMLADAGGFLKRGLGKPTWTCAQTCADAVNQLEKLRLKDQRRRIQMVFRGNQLHFEDAQRALDFLRPYADLDRVSAMKQKKLSQDAAAQEDDAVPPLPHQNSGGCVRGALHCSAGHPIQRKAEASGLTWFSKKRKCHACGVASEKNITHWRCTSNCNYTVCNICFQRAVWDATQRYVEQRTESANQVSEVSTSEGGAPSEAPPSVDSCSAGPRIELRVQCGERQEIHMFDSRPLDVQLVELSDSLGLTEHLSSLALVRTCGADIEILRAQTQLHTLVPLTLISLERAEDLVSACLADVSRAAHAEDALAPLRQLLAILSASKALAEEAFSQDAFSTLEQAAQLGGMATEPACAAMCCMFKSPRHRSKTLAQVRDSWNERGSSLLFCLARALFPRNSSEKVASQARPCRATLAVLLRLLEEVSSAAGALHSLAMGELEASGVAFYPQILAFLRDPREEFRKHAAKLTLCTLLRAAGSQFLQPELPDRIREEIAQHVDDTGWLDDSVTECGSAELLDIFTGTCAESTALKQQMLQQEVHQLRDEVRFKEMLQKKLRQSHKAMCEMVSFVKVGDRKVEDTLSKIVHQGWESITWPEGYSLLHFLSEYACEPRLVRLAAELCPDLDLQDEAGKRPMDYALENPYQEVAECLVAISQSRVANGLRNSTVPYKQLEMDTEIPAFDKKAVQAMSKSQEVVHEVSKSQELLHDVSKSQEVVHDESNKQKLLHDASKNQEVVHDESKKQEVLHGVSKNQEAVRDMSRSQEVLHSVSKNQEMVRALSKSQEASGVHDASAGLISDGPQKSHAPATRHNKEPEIAGSEREDADDTACQNDDVDDDDKDAVSDPHNVGTVFMLRTQLAVASRENASLKEKVGELESLRTRLAILTEQCKDGENAGAKLRPEVLIPSIEAILAKQISDSQLAEQVQSSSGRGSVSPPLTKPSATPRQDAVELTEGKEEKDASKDSQPSKMSTDGPTSEKREATNETKEEPEQLAPESSENPENATTNIKSKEDGSETSSQPAKGPAKGKGKTKKGPSPPPPASSSPPPGETVAPASSEDSQQSSSSGDGADPAPAPVAPPKGKGKGKGKKGPPLPPPASSSSAAAEPAAPASSEDDAEAAPASAPVAPPKGKGKAKGGPPPPGPGAAPGAEKGKAKGKSKAPAVEPSKPNMAPSQDMKTLPWTRYVVGAQIEEGTTIWDAVNSVYDAEHLNDLLPVDEMEQRFGKRAGLQKVEKVDRKEKKKVELARLDSIAQDQRFQIEVSLKTLPLNLSTGSKAVAALRELNRAVLSAEAFSTLHRFLCPTPEQEQELVLKRQAYEQWVANHPGDGPQPDPFRWAAIEEYMEELRQLPACATRLSCCAFMCNLPDRLNQLQDGLDLFEQMVFGFRESTGLPSLLSVILAVGNFLNGGKNEKRLGQADGFHIELLGRPGGLDVVNDAQGRNVRQLIFQVYFEKYGEQADKLMHELAPMFALVQRRIGKDSDNVPQLRRSVRIQIEELDKQLSQLKGEFASKHKELKEGLNQITDPADKFVVEIPKEFEHAKKRIDGLSERNRILIQQFKALLASFKAETYRGDSKIVDGQMQEGNPKEEMTSEVWVKIWDNFFVAADRVLSYDEKKQKECIEPRFCKDAPLSVESLQILWGLIPATTPGMKKRKSSTAEPSRARNCHSF